MPAVSADQTVEGPNPEGLKRSHLNTGVLEEFAQNMSENIIQSFQSQMEPLAPEWDCRASRLNQNREMLAEEFASAVIEVALREVFGGPNLAVRHLEGSAVVETDGMDSERSTETSKDTRHCHPSLSQPGLTDGGSLDYPDAPPTTPLLPELERSRHSFSRMLKGGLAKVYPPSTPPPTPNDGNGEGHGAAASDPQVELMEHLMHSLFTDDSSRDCFEEGSRRGAKMAAFAEALSRNIVDSVLSDKNGGQTADDSDLHLLAHQLAGAIITSSLDEAKTLV